MRFKKAYLFAFISLILLAKAAERGVLVGILEDVPGHYAGEADIRAIRVVFEKNGSDWRAFPCDCPDTECLKKAASKYPAEVNWTIVFEGRNLGNLRSRARKIDYYSDIGLQEIVNPSFIPTIGNRSEKNATQSAESLYRPLIAVSKPNFNDPEKWRTADISSEILISARRLFRQKFPTLCTMKQDEAIKPFKYQDKDIKLKAAYASNRGWILAALNLKDALDCSHREPLIGIDFWFVADPQSKARYLNVGGRLVDAGDYDHDGRSELIFQTGAYNSGGYLLYYDDFRKCAVFKFSYH